MEVQSDNVSSLAHLKTFMEFVCKEKAIPVDDVMAASVALLKHCPSSRQAILKFYKKLLFEYCLMYSKTYGKRTFAEVDVVPEYLPRFVQALVEANEVGKNNVKEEKVNPDDDIKMEEDGPSSPTREVAEMDLEAGELPGKESDISVVISQLDMHMNILADIFVVLQETNESPEFTASISDWSLELVSEMSQKYDCYITDPNARLLNSNKSDHLALMTALGFWLQCSAMQLLLRVILTSACSNKMDAKTLVDRLLKYSPFSDWILAHLCTNISQSLDLTKYIEELITDSSSFSTTFILSYVSEHNPQAIVNCSKSNLPLLLKLCTNSKPLLDMLAYDVVKKGKFHLFDLVNLN